MHPKVLDNITASRFQGRKQAFEREQNIIGPMGAVVDHDRRRKFGHYFRKELWITLRPNSDFDLLVREP